ncbi:MAG: hypothetical protein GT600_17245 [Bacteroidales bacterium]|jgi:hypothetical protein|nr:hypothetical protein [Bacteroidales bacterium]OQB60055.1 MAG: hypothetical protein BWX96_02408 [Bacteroidetes bacterium ADurb.Bin145]HQK68276.1 hypothetical protein [Bacteroidales bacterium]
MKINLGTANGTWLREQFPNSEFLDPAYDKCIVGVTESGNVIYHHYDLLYTVMDERQDEFDGDDYEQAKDDFTQEFQDFYDIIDEQLGFWFNNLPYETEGEIPAVTDDMNNEECDEE